MAWRRIGRLYAPSGEAPWLASHASVPFAEPLGGSLFRIWFSPRDVANHSHITWLVIDIERPGAVIDIERPSAVIDIERPGAVIDIERPGAGIEMSPAPVLGCGPPGAYDDCGAMMSWLAGERLYYIGWTTRGTVPFHVCIGAADNFGEHRRHGPVMDRTPDDPWFCSNPCVLPDGAGWRMWYLGGLGWEETGGRWSPSYHICHAHSADGLRWEGRGRVAVSLAGDEYALARPSVLRTAEGWLMWFCARTRQRPYRLAAARSADGLAWERAPDLAGLAPAADGWDSEMVAYPHVFDHAGGRFMLYCGNGFGRSGFGLAVWQ